MKRRGLAAEKLALGDIVYMGADGRYHQVNPVDVPDPTREVAFWGDDRLIAMEDVPEYGIVNKKHWCSWHKGWSFDDMRGACSSCGGARD